VPNNRKRREIPSHKIWKKMIHQEETEKGPETLHSLRTVSETGFEMKPSRKRINQN
jgi:hypothetical protein